MPLEDVPAGTKILKSLSIRSTKKNGPKKGDPKVRICLNGREMEKGVHYTHSYSPGLQFASLRALLATAAIKEKKGKKAKLAGGDFPQAYLNAMGDLVYMWPPRSAPQHDAEGRRLVWKVPMALYGGKASGRHWYNFLRGKLESYGFVASEWDPCVFTRERGDDFYIIGVYVDDTVHVYSDDAEHAELKAQFEKDFHGYSDLGPLKEIFNAEVAQNPNHILMTQTRYIEDMIENYPEIDLTHKHRTPAATEKLLDLAYLVDHAKSLKATVDPELHRKYRAIVGALLYVAMLTRPDVAYAVGMLSRALECPTPDLMAAALRVLNYLYHTRKLGLRWTRGAGAKMYGQVDSDWAKVKSTSGYVFYLAEAVFAYLSKGQPCIAMSSTEAEIMAASLAALEAVFLRGTLGSCLLKQSEPTEIGIDNQGAIALAESYVSNSRTKHIERRHLKIRELVTDMQVKPTYVPTSDNSADILTKPLGRRVFEKHRNTILNYALQEV